MQKIITLFKRNFETDGLVYNEVTPGAEWVINGEGDATRKWDGTCCMVKDGLLYKRYDSKHGKKPPRGFIAAQDAPDPITGHWPGWVLVDIGPNNFWHIEAWNRFQLENGERFEHEVEGTYELCGPKINGNKEQLTRHFLIKHGNKVLETPRNYNDLRLYFSEIVHMEGIVWHHPDGRMVKIKSRDFGIKW